MSKREKKTAISLEPGEESLGKLLHDAHKRLSAGLIQTIEEAGYPMHLDAWAILNLLWSADDLPQFEIGARIDRDRHQTSRLIDSLCTLDLVERRPGESDRRIKHVVLTRSGREAEEPLKKLATTYLEEKFHGISHEDYMGFVTCLKHLAHPSPSQENTSP